MQIKFLIYHGEQTFKIAIYDSINKPKTLLDKLKLSKLEKGINESANLLILTTPEAYEEEIKKINIPITKTTSYGIANYDNLSLITIDVTNGGLRTTDYTQWINLQNDIKNSKNKNILVLMKGNLENFTDKNEKKLFIDVMCEIKRNTGKNIWIINEDNYTTYSMERGIRYLSVNNSNYDKNAPIEVAKNDQYILITIENNNLTYEIKNIFK